MHPLSFIRVCNRLVHPDPPEHCHSEDIGFRVLQPAKIHSPIGQNLDVGRAEGRTRMIDFYTFVFIDDDRRIC